MRPALTYGSEWWAMKVSNKSKIATSEMRMPRGILGVSRWDHKQNEETRRILRRCGHVQRRDMNNVMRPHSDGPDSIGYQTTKTP